MILYQKNPWKRWGLAGFVFVFIICLILLSMGSISTFLSEDAWINGMMLMSVAGAGGLLAASISGITHHCYYNSAVEEQWLASRIAREADQTTDALTVTIPITTLDVYQHIYSPEHHAFCSNQLITEFNKQYLTLSRKQLDEFTLCAANLKRDYLKVHPEHTERYLQQLIQSGYLHGSEPVLLIENRLTSLALPPIKNTILSPIIAPLMSPTAMRRFQQSDDVVLEPKNGVCHAN